MPVGVDLSHGADGVEGESVWTNADDGAYLCLSLDLAGSMTCESSDGMARTVFLMIFELNEMPITCGGTVRVNPICGSGEQRALVLGQRMHCETITEDAREDLECRKS